MKKNFLLFALLGVLTLTFTACDGNNPDKAYPRKHLIEEFTSQYCGYCPGGMDAIHTFIGDDPNWVLILHHYGYYADNFSAKGGNTITTQLGVNGAPNITIDRSVTNYLGSRSALVFGPTYLATTNKEQFSKTTYASIKIENSYDEGTGYLDVHVSGNLAKQDHPTLYLTVLIKESGMVDFQADYVHAPSDNVWTEFRHTNAVRYFLSEPLGDEVFEDSKGNFEADYSIKMLNKWNPDNCSVVAFLNEELKPVLQVEQAPVIAGTSGGNDIVHGGIK